MIFGDRKNLLRDINELRECVSFYKCEVYDLTVTMSNHSMKPLPHEKRKGESVCFPIGNDEERN